MTPEISLTLIFNAVMTVINILCVIIIPSILIGLVVAIIQAATSVQEQTLSFFPRLIVILLMILFSGHWIVRTLVDWFSTLSVIIPEALN